MPLCMLRDRTHPAFAKAPRLSLVLAAWVLLAAPSAVAEEGNTSAARDHFEKGLKLFDLLHYREAALEFEAAYQAKSSPAFLYNIAQAHRLAGDHDKAIASYRSYLRRTPDATNRTDVEARIAESEVAIARTGPGHLPGPTGAAMQSPPQKPLPQMAKSASPAETPSRPGWGKKAAGGALLGVGLAAVAAGVVSGVRSASAAETARIAADGTLFDPGLEEAFHVNRSLAIGMIAGGAAITLTGALLVALGVRDARLASIAVLPALSPERVGASATIHF